MSFYIAGPMSGIPRFNFPAFDEAAKKLRASGWEITTPTELDDDDVREYALASPDGTHDAEKAGATLGDLFARDVKIITDECAGVILLNGWSKSRGARLEAFVALLCGKPIYRYNNGFPVTVRSWQVARPLVQEWLMV